MKNGLKILVFLAASGIATQGEMIRFDPPSQFVDLDVDDSVIFFEIYVESTSVWNYFNSIDVFLGSDYVNVSDFALNPDFIESTGIFNKVQQVGKLGGYDSTIFTGGFTPVGLPRPYYIGTLTVDTNSMPSGEYTIQVDSLKDGNKSNVTIGNIADGYHQENLFGYASITVKNSAILPTCFEDSDCDDGIDCTSDRCNISQCENIYLDGCDDGSESGNIAHLIEKRGGGHGDLLTFSDIARVEYEVENIVSTTPDLPSSIAQLPSLCGTIGMIPLMFMMMGLSGYKVRPRY